MQSVMLGLGAVATVSAIAPILLPLPKPVATSSLLLSVGAGLGLSVLAKQYERTEQIHAAQFETGMQWLRQDMALQRSTQAHAQTALTKMELLLEAQSLPLALQPVFLAEFGLAPLQQPQRQAVTTTAVEVPQRVEGAIASTPTAAFAPQQYQQQQRSVLPTEDLARTYALMTRDGSTIRNVLMPAEPGVGKSTFVCAVIHHLNAIHNGQVDMRVFAGKLPEPDKDPGYCGLEKSDNDYIFSGDYEAAPKVVDRLQALTDLTKQDAKEWPTVIIQDELNNTLDAVKMFDKASPKAKLYPKRYEILLALNDMRLTQGRSRRVVDFITAHSKQVGDIGYNTSKQDAFDRIIPGRYPMALNTIDRALRSKTFITSDEQRLELQLLFEEFLSNPTEGVVALTNLGGTWRLVQLPDYRQYTTPIQRGMLNQGSEELAEEFEEDVWEDSVQQQASKERLYVQLIDEVNAAQCFSKPKHDAITHAAQVTQSFFAKHNNPCDRDRAQTVAEYLWSLHENGELPS